MSRTRTLALLAVGVALATALTAPPAEAKTSEVLGQYGVPRSGRICIEDNGWTLYNDALPGLAQRMRAAGVANVTVWDECDGPNGQKNVYHTLDRVIDIVTTNSPNENYCGRIERVWKWNGSKWLVASTNIRINLGIPRCYNTAFARQHGVSHEVMHAFAMVHEGTAERVVGSKGWDYAWPTAYDYADLRKAGYTDLN